MRTQIRHSAPLEQGSLLAYMLIALVTLTAVASVTTFVVQTTNLARRGCERAWALQFAEGGAAVACGDLARAFDNTFTSNEKSLPWQLQHNSGGVYSLNSSLSAGTSNVFERTVTAPFTDQSVQVQIWLPKTNNAQSGIVIGQATVGRVTQTAVTHVQMVYGYGAAILSDHPGTTKTGVDKSTAQGGNVCINGDKNGPTLIDGGSGWAILANGRANVDLLYAKVATNAISMTNYNTANEIPDYTAIGSSDQLFDFNRFIAVADLTPNGPSPSKNNHFTNMPSFIAAQKNYSRTNPMEGVVVISLTSKLMVDIDQNDFPNGINIRGTLVMDYGADVGEWDKMINTATMNINPADLTGLNPTNPATYKSGLPVVYTDPTKDPVNIDISSKGFANFMPGDDMPALMYSNGILDIHGNCNISGVVYTSSFVEIENKADYQLQYFRGSIIGGNGIYIENTKKSATVVSYDPNCLDLLATSAGKGKKVAAIFWQ